MSLLNCWNRMNRRRKSGPASFQHQRLSRRLHALRLEERSVPAAGLIAVGTDVGVQAQVRIFADADNNDT